MSTKFTHSAADTKLANAAEDIINIFSWKTTEQGFQYWDTVYNNLTVLSLEAAKQAKDEAERKAREEATAKREAEEVARIKRTGAQSERLFTAARELDRGLTWHQTAEGHEYWLEVKQKLQKYAKDAEKIGK